MSSHWLFVWLSSPSPSVLAAASPAPSAPRTQASADSLRPATRGRGGTGRPDRRRRHVRPRWLPGGAPLLQRRPARAARCPFRRGCGDGINNQGGIEACDDGNTLAGDGCNGACQIEPNWACPAAGACMRSFRCGDSVINPGEVCDDGNANDGDGCNANCSVQTPGYVCTPGRLCTSTSMCGNRRSSPVRPATTATRPPTTGAARPARCETGCSLPGARLALHAARRAAATAPST